MTVSPPRKKLIEVSIPLEAINRASAREKSIRHGHPSTLHLWWARRPLAACRAVLFSQLVDDPSAWPDKFPTEAEQETERLRLHRVIEKMVPWEASNDETILNEARWEIARSVAWGRGEEPPPREDGKEILAYLQQKAPPVYDPFSGGASIPLEAQRLGLRAYGSDLNPVAVLIGKALVEIPPKFAGKPPVNPKSQAELKRGGRWNGEGAQGLAEDVRYYGQWMRDEAEKRIGHLYPKAELEDGSEATVIAWLWARTVRSPDPTAKGAMVPLVSSFMLSTKEGKKAWVQPVIEATAQDGWRFEVKSGQISKAEENRLSAGTKAGRGSNFICLLTGSPIDAGYIKREASDGRMVDRLFAIVAEGTRKRVYLSPQQKHERVVRSAVVDDSIADIASSTHPQYMGCASYGIRNVRDMFTRRQRAALSCIAALVEETSALAARDAVGTSLAPSAEEYGKAVATYIGLIVGRSANYWSEFNFWSGDFIVQTFARQALSLVWDHAEVNPFSASTGNLNGAVEWTAKALEASAPGSGYGSVTQLAAQHNNYPIAPVVVSTDPPYYDNIPYADLSDFFYAWLRLSLKFAYPELLRRIAVPKADELVADMKRHGGRQEADTFFNSGMQSALTAINRAAADDGPITIYYAFKQTSEGEEGTSSTGWASFLQSVVDGGYILDGTWPIRTERPGGNRNASRNSLASSVVLVCRKRPPNSAVSSRAEFVRRLKLDLPAAIAAIRAAGVGPVDMQQSVIGPGMGVFTRCDEVLEDDDSKMTVKTALSIINRVWEEIDNEIVASFDPETQVALAWFASYGFDPRPSGELITLANAKDTSINDLFDAEVFTDLRGRTVLTPRESLAPQWSPARDRRLTVWECVQHLARTLNAEGGGAQAAARLIAEMGPKATDARALLDRLFQIATDKGWAQEALVYNQLAEEWPHLLERSTDISDDVRPAETGDLFA